MVQLHLRIIPYWSVMLVRDDVLLVKERTGTY